MRFYFIEHFWKKRAGLFLRPIALIFLAALAGTAQDLKGSWVGWMQVSDFFGALRLDIKESGSTVTLFFAGDKRSGAIEELKVDGSTVSFDGKMQPNARFKGALTGDRLSGTLDIVTRAGVVADSGSFEVRPVDSSYQPRLAAKPIDPQPVGLPAPTGRYAIGRRFFYWTDESRLERITPEATDHRRLFVQIWYPARKERNVKPAVYFPQDLTSESGRTDTSDSIKTNASVDAAIVGGRQRFPLIVFSPGLGSSPLKYASIIEDLVSHGYVVAAINHPYDSGPALWPDGTRIMQDKKWNAEVPKDWSADERKKFFDERRLEWARDASYVVDQFKKLDLGKRIDLERIGMLAHSFGGQAASIVCAADARFKACANLDGLAQGNAVLPDASGNTMTQPFLFFTKAPEITDAELEMTGLTRAEYRAREQKRLTEKWKPSFKTQIAAVPSGGYLVVYPGITHGTFSDGPLTDPKSAKPFTERVATAQLISAYILAFFDKVLLGKDPSLLKPGVGKEGVIVEFLKK